MCYDIKTSLEKQLRRALLDGNRDDVQTITEKLSIFSKNEVNLHHASGFDHPRMFIYTNEMPLEPVIATWGLVPSSSIDNQSIWNKTLNARGETIFEKASFKGSAELRRCLIFLEGFYEHHHKYGKTFPYFIKLKDKEIFAVTGLWSEWKNEKGGMLKTFTIVTTKANYIMSEIHNNPKLPEPRMPLILPEESQNQWLNNELTKHEIEELIKPISSQEMKAHTVGPIKGKNAVGNVLDATKEIRYQVLETDQLNLF